MELGVLTSKFAISFAQSRLERLERISAAFSTCRYSVHYCSSDLRPDGGLDLSVRFPKRTSFGCISSSTKFVLVAYNSSENARTDESTASYDATESIHSDLSPEILRNLTGLCSQDEVRSQDLDHGEGSGGGSGDSGGRGFGGGDSGGESSGEDDEDQEYGPLLNAEQVQRELDVRGVQLPPDMLEAAKCGGIRKLLLQRYFEMQTAPWPLGSAFVSNRLLRNRMLADPRFLFKLSTEIAIATGCATVAEVEKRGANFWNEFELYASDMLVGIAFDIVLVGLMAPFVRFGATSSTVAGTRTRLFRSLQALPSNMFEAQRPGRTFTSLQRISTLFYKAVQYGVAGFGCGIIGQGIASGFMTVKRELRKGNTADTEDEVEVPNVVKSAAVWSLFMATSANVRYQCVTGLESVVERSIIGKRMPQAALLFTVCVRLANNVYGAMQFVDLVRWAGVQ